jgi:hypothetical protein
MGVENLVMDVPARLNIADLRRQLRFVHDARIRQQT